mmetsp:Transcript_28250/g.81279  ORF Transcript_28250/g.81279 Transcript_28250/m.81279 type:complete len:281 (+) Transcript_28250:57-899(+)
MARMASGMDEIEDGDSVYFLPSGLFKPALFTSRKSTNKIPVPGHLDLGSGVAPIRAPQDPLLSEVPFGVGRSWMRENDECVQMGAMEANIMETEHESVSEGAVAQPLPRVEPARRVPLRKDARLWIPDGFCTARISAHRRIARAVNTLTSGFATCLPDDAKLSAVMEDWGWTVSVLLVRRDDSTAKRFIAEAKSATECARMPSQKVKLCRIEDMQFGFQAVLGTRIDDSASRTQDEDVWYWDEAMYGPGCCWTKGCNLRHRIDFMRHVCVHVDELLEVGE